MLPRPGLKRFLLVTLGITGLYLALNTLWLALTPSLAALFDERTASAWARDAAAVADAARDADSRLPVATRVAAYRLGFHVGYCSNVLGSVALSGPEVQSRVREILAPRIKAAQDLGSELGVGEVSLLPVSNAEEFGRVNDRLDSDELGLAARVEKATSRRHRHLLLLGMHVGRRRAHRHERRQTAAAVAPVHRPSRHAGRRAASRLGTGRPRGGRQHARTTGGRVSGRAHRVGRGCDRAGASAIGGDYRSWTFGACNETTVSITKRYTPCSPERVMQGVQRAC